MPNKHTIELIERLQRMLSISEHDAREFRRCAMILSRWGELECGDGNDDVSWAIERDEKTEKPYMVVYPRKGQSSRSLIPDREKGALKRIKALCTLHGLHFYYQTDPRGASLYLSREPMTDQNYSSGVAVYK